MIHDIESRLTSDWKDYAELYNHVRSAVHYSAHLKGLFGNAVPYNIETLVNALYELERNEEHPLYPFVGSWNFRFLSLAGPRFEHVRDFRRNILRALKDWMCPRDPSKADYYKGLVDAQRALNFPLLVFSLNYDRCVESLVGPDFVVETGFGGIGPKHPWDWERFNKEPAGRPLPQVFLYKLHGSIDWVRDSVSKEVSRVEQIHVVSPEEMEVIFGREFKLEAADPYLFYAYELRQATIESRLVVSVGYGFVDDHINKMLSQALRPRLGTPKRLLVVSNCTDPKARDDKRIQVATALGVSEEVVIVEEGTAKSFLGSAGLGERLLATVPDLPGSGF